MWSSFHPRFGLSAIAKRGCVTASRSLNELLVKGNEGLAPSTLRHLFTETDAERVPGDLMLEGEAEGDLSFRKANVQGGLFLRNPHFGYPGSSCSQSKA